MCGVEGPWQGVGTLLRMILVPGCSQEHAHSRLELGDYGHRVQWERLVGSTFCMEEVTLRGWSGVL